MSDILEYDEEPGARRGARRPPEPRPMERRPLPPEPRPLELRPPYNWQQSQSSFDPNYERLPSTRLYDDEPRVHGPLRYEAPATLLEQGAVMRPPTARLETGATMQPPPPRLQAGPSTKPPLPPAKRLSDTSSSSRSQTTQETQRRIIKPQSMVKGPGDSVSSMTASRLSTDIYNPPRSDRFRTSSDFATLADRRDSVDSRGRGHINSSFEGSYDEPDRLNPRDRPQFVRDLDRGQPRSSYERAREDSYIERVQEKEQSERQSYQSDDSDSEKIEIYKHRLFRRFAIAQLILGMCVMACGVVLTQLPAWSRQFSVGVLLGIVLTLNGAFGIINSQARQLGMIKIYKYTNYACVCVSLLLLAFYLADVTMSHAKFYDGYYPYILTPDGPMLHLRYMQSSAMLALIIVLIVLGPVHLVLCYYQIKRCNRTLKAYAPRAGPRVYDARRPPRNDPVMRREQERVTYISTQSLV